MRVSWQVCINRNDINSQLVRSFTELCLYLVLCYYVSAFLNPLTPRGVRGTIPLAFFPCNFFDDYDCKNHLVVSVSMEGRHISAYVISS